MLDRNCYAKFGYNSNNEMVLHTVIGGEMNIKAGYTVHVGSIDKGGKSLYKSSCSETMP